VLARLIKVTIVVVPLIAAVVVNRVVAWVLPRPGGLGPSALWFVFTIAVSMVGYHMGRRLLMRAMW
jgi:hypothetical protein